MCTNVAYGCTSVLCVFLGKLSEFNSQAGEGSQVSEADLKQVERLVTDGASTVTAQQLSILWKLMQWPVGELFQC